MATLQSITPAPRRGITRQRLRLAVAVVAWFLAAGSHWELVQCVAWTKMFVEYLQEDCSVVEALAMTFDPDNACSLCEVVEQAREDAPDKESPEGKAKAKAGEKELLFAQTVADFHFNTPTQDWWDDCLLIPERREAAPPTPPPRHKTVS